MLKSVESFVQILGEDARLKSVVGVIALFHSFLEITAKIVQTISIGELQLFNRSIAHIRNSADDGALLSL